MVNIIFKSKINLYYIISYILILGNIYACYIIIRFNEILLYNTIYKILVNT